MAEDALADVQAWLSDNEACAPPDTPQVLVEEVEEVEAAAEAGEEVTKRLERALAVLQGDSTPLDLRAPDKT